MFQHYWGTAPTPIIPCQFVQFVDNYLSNNNSLIIITIAFQIVGFLK
jgi:hypothetical protein